MLNDNGRTKTKMWSQSTGWLVEGTKDLDICCLQHLLHFPTLQMPNPHAPATLTPVLLGSPGNLREKKVVNH